MKFTHYFATLKIHAILLEITNKETVGGVSCLRTGLLILWIAIFESDTILCWEKAGIEVFNMFQSDLNGFG